MRNPQTILQEQINEYDKQLENLQTQISEIRLRKSELERALKLITTDTTVHLTPRKKRPTSNKPIKITVPNTGITITDAMIDHEKTKELQGKIDTDKPGLRPNPNAYLLCLTNNTAWTSFSTLAKTMGRSTSFFYNTAKQNNGKITSHDYDFQWFIPNTNLPIQEDGEHYDSVDHYATAKGEDVNTVIHALLCGSKKLDIQPA